MDVVFLIGAARSGTKILRNTLASSSEVAAIPFDINYIWRYRNQNIPHDELKPSMLSDSKIRYIRKKIFHYAKKANPKAKIVVEKTVANPLRIEFIREIFPEARFIHLLREGEDVVASSVNQWNKEPDLKYIFRKISYFPFSNISYLIWYISNLISGVFLKQHGGKTWGPRYKGIYSDLAQLDIETICAKQWAECVLKAQVSLSKLPSNAVFSLRYEDFVNNVEVLNALSDFLGIDKKPVIVSHKQNVVSSNVGKSSIKSEMAIEIIKEATRQLNKQ